MSEKEGTSPSLVKVGEVVSVHGIKGYLKAKISLENPSDISKYQIFDKNGDYLPLSFEGMNKKLSIISMDKIDSRDRAEELIATEFFIDKNTLPKAVDGEFYFSDLIGLEVVLEDNSLFGAVKSVDNFGAGDVLEIKLAENGKTEMFIFDEDTFPSVDIKNRKIVINLPEEIIVEP